MQRGQDTQEVAVVPEKKQFIRILALDTPLGRSLAFFLFILLAGSIAANAVTLYLSWERTVEDAESKAINLSLSQVRQADDTFLQTELTLQEIRRNLAYGYLPDHELNASLAELEQRLPQLDGLFIYDAHGAWRNSSFGQEPAEDNIADRDDFLYHKDHGWMGIHIGHVVRSKISGQLVIPVSLRINDITGGFAGVVMATVKMDYFRQFYSYFELTNNDILALLLVDGKPLYIRPFDESVLNKDLSDSPLFTQVLLRARQGSATWLSALDQVVRIYGFARSTRYPIVVVAGYDKDNLRATWLKNSIPDLLINGALLTAIILMGMVLFRQVRVNIRDRNELATLRDELVKINHTLHSMAMVDGLTGLANRRRFDAFLEQALADSAVTGNPVSLILIDVDFFKRYNDNRGHVAGDACLRRIGGVLQQASFSHGDLVARYGGEEFAIILSETSSADALRVAEKVVSMVREQALPHPDTELPDGVVTISAGCYSMTSDGRMACLTELIKGADEALYQAKSTGRNRAVLLS
ncbi:diguanylate cyclase [Cronobacter sakazakii]|nr:sensor domain-containing diguanylate cyclase [Cronobacter sakazakii]